MWNRINYQLNIGIAMRLHEISKNAKEYQSDGTENHSSRCWSQGQTWPDPCFSTVSVNSWLVFDPVFS